jgi:predicted ATPase
MITKWKVSNFKSIREETELTLGPLTIFAGANSSGKSTFIQSILLVAQTLAHKVGSRSVVLNGALTSLGQFDDLKSNGSESDQITIKYTCRPLPEQDGTIPKRSSFTPRGSIYYGPRSNQLQEIVCEISFDADPSSSQRDLFQIQPRLFATQLSCTSRDEDNVDQKAEIAIRHSSKAISEIDGMDSINEFDDQFRASLAYEVDLDDVSLAEVKEEFKSARPIGCMLRHFLPERIIYAIDIIQEDANTIALALQDDGRRTNGLPRSMGREVLLSEEIIAVLRDVLKGTVDFDQVFKDKYRQESLFGPDSKAMTFRAWHERLRTIPREERMKVHQVLRECENLFDRIYEAMKPPKISASDSHAFVPARPPRQITEAAWYLNNFFASSLKYLGPLRDAPKPLYPLAPAADPHDVGLRGEHTASILDLHKNKKVKFIPSANFKVPAIDRKTVTRTLEAAVIDWLQYLGVASSVKSRDQGKLGHELKVELSNSDSSHDLTHVGVGVSQVLPILVMCLLADTDSTLVFEQPELHLHPKVQTLLGDFFLSMALCNKQCIVETHSEYIIDRLRFRIAAASSETELNSQTQIYFVAKPSQGSSFREVVINEYGAISDWPDGFFDQSQQQAEEILRAAAMKRKARRSKSDA